MTTRAVKTSQLPTNERGRRGSAWLRVVCLSTVALAGHVRAELPAVADAAFAPREDVHDGSNGEGAAELSPSENVSVSAPNPLARGAGTRQLDGLAAVLGGANPTEPARTILQSDVELRARLSLLGRNSERALFGELPRSLLRATLSELIGEQLIAIEAERVQIAPPTPSEIVRELGELERAAGGRPSIVRLLAWLDASQLELEATAARRALIGAFLRANLEGVNVVTESDVDARLRSDASRFAAQTPDVVRSAVRATLAKEALTRHIEHWVRTLRARTRVRVFAVYDTP